MLKKIISDKNHTISELKTLRMQGRASLESLKIAFDRQNKIYLGQKMITTDLTKGTKEHELANQRLLGQKELLDVLKTLVSQTEAKLKQLDEEFKTSPKYPKHKKNSNKQPEQQEIRILEKEPHVESLAIEDVSVQSNGSG
jgi:hypothetical protein